MSEDRREVLNDTYNYTDLAGLRVAATLANFVNNLLLPRIGMDREHFWEACADIIHDLTPRNTALLQRRDTLQAQIDAWHRERRGQPHDGEAYAQFLRDIGYLLPSPEDFQIGTTNVDQEIAVQAGPQLVVPVKNARFALNAANARWGSLYDALYGTDVIGEEDGAAREVRYNPVRGARVIAYVREFLDQACPLSRGSHRDALDYSIEDGELRVQLEDNRVAGLRDPRQLAGYRGKPTVPEAVLLRNHGLHVEIEFAADSEVGADDPAHISDVILEAAITTIQDCEDSVAAVDAEDKVAVYRNWLGLITGELEDTFIKNGKRMTRSLNKDRQYLDAAGKKFTLPGRSLMLIRNVGHLMRSDAILDQDREPVYEGILDALLTSAIALLDLRGETRRRNSRSGSIYIVKPKMHGPEEVSFSCELFSRVEQALDLEPNTIKIGIMDEERRTTLNLKACIAAARDRVVFINTGFLDRTGDEIHTSMEAGVMVPKADMKHSTWIQAYEDNNVNLGLACGLPGRAQIGKGMWAMPDLMARMVKEKIAHPMAGANTAWVPSPTAAVLHALHYHQVDVRARQQELRTRPPVSVADLLTIPLLADPATLSPEQVQLELDNNVQGILGYVVRWIDQGIGCSKVPDIHDIGLMEDRATLRISSQHIANWLHHGVCSKDQVLDTLKRMAIVVDGQNRGDEAYEPMAPDYDRSIAFAAACQLVFTGRQQPNGYTEPVLHARRQEKKQSAYRVPGMISKPAS
ncbi:MAG: hypothetical protein RLZZ385_1944 [Pseudomonadota bacterium]|jgi:malate synthase